MRYVTDISIDKSYEGFCADWATKMQSFVAGLCGCGTCLNMDFLSYTFFYVNYVSLVG